MIRIYINNNKGTHEDAKDILQDAIISIYKKVIHDDLVVKCEFRTFLFSVCKNLWFKELRSRNIQNRNLIDYESILEPFEDFNNIYEKNEKNKFYLNCFSKLNPECQRLLNLYMDRTPLKDIARIMGHTEGYMKSKKYKCKKKLIEIVKQAIKYEELIK